MTTHDLEGVKADWLGKVAVGEAPLSTLSEQFSLQFSTVSTVKEIKGLTGY